MSRFKLSYSIYLRRRPFVAKVVQTGVLFMNLQTVPFTKYKALVLGLFHKLANRLNLVGIIWRLFLFKLICGLKLVEVFSNLFELTSLPSWNESSIRKQEQLATIIMIATTLLDSIMIMEGENFWFEVNLIDWTNMLIYGWISRFRFNC